MLYLLHKRKKGQGILKCYHCPGTRFLSLSKLESRACSSEEVSKKMVVILKCL